jgi:dienelactone hydrolase
MLRRYVLSAQTAVLRGPGGADRLRPVNSLKGSLQACSIVALFLGATVTAQARAIAGTFVTTVAPNAEGQPAITAEGLVFQTSVSPQPDEDLAAACRYEIILTNLSRTVQAVWVIFERSRETLEYYRDAEVRAFARRHDLALLFPFHCPSRSETGGDMNVDPSKGIGRALFAALTQLAQSSRHPELGSAKLILLGFSGTGSLVGRLAECAPDRVLAVIPTAPGHFDPLGVDTISLPQKAVAIPHLILVGSSDAVSGTQRPYEYFRRHFDQGAPWTFVVQNKAPHCCIMNAKALILLWVDAVVVQRLTRASGWYGFIKNQPSQATDCPDQSAPARAPWCRNIKDAWGGANWSVSAAIVERRPNPPKGLLIAGWLPTQTFAARWVSFVTKPEHPVRLPP